MRAAFPPPVTASTLNGVVTLGDTATSANLANTMVKRDPEGSFSAGSITLTGNLILPASSATSGIVYFHGRRLLGSYGAESFFVGPSAGNLASSGSYNTGVGLNALSSNTFGSANTASGAYALQNNTEGAENTANGYQALCANTSGYDNTANGIVALHANTSGFRNTATGDGALYSNTTGFENTASGDSALANNTNGCFNTASGGGALNGNTLGSDNTAIGYGALYFVTGSNNIAVGSSAGVGLSSGNGNIYIGSTGPQYPAATENYTLRIGDKLTNAYIGGVSAFTVPNGAAVYVSSSGQLGTLTSSARFKEHIQSMDHAERCVVFATTGHLPLQAGA